MIEQTTYKDFADWLAAHEPGQVVGCNGDPLDDPLAHHLSQINGRTIGVSRRTVYVHEGNCAREEEPLADWQERYVARSEECPLWDLTAEDTLELLIPGPGGS